MKATDNELKILLTEDDPIVQKVHSRMLEKLGYKVAIAANGKNALQLFSEENFGLILMDLGLPDIGGIDVAAEMRHRENKNEYTPIIAITAFIKHKIEEECFKAGIDRVVAKPVKMNDLKQIIQETMGEK